MRRDVDLSGRVAATRIRIAKDRLGITALEEELERMIRVNNVDKRAGEELSFDENLIDNMRDRIAELSAQLPNNSARAK